MGDAAEKRVIDMTAGELAAFIVDTIRAERTAEAGPRLASTRDFAKEIQASQRSVRMWCAQGMPCEMAGADYRVVRAEAKVWLAEQAKAKKSRK